jgi:predicted deacetylase
MSAEQKLFCVSLHDVAPATLRDCRETLAFLAEQGIGPVALLVVPDYHGGGRADRDEQFRGFLRERAAHGDEIVLHGFIHQDTAAPGRGLRDWLERRMLADGEAEFARLDHDAARTRILRGLAVLRAAGWHPRGFVAPAWIMSPGTQEVLESLPLDYYATRDYVVPVRGPPIPAPSLVVSTRSAWRRGLSQAWNRTRLSHRQRMPVLRAALHPRDLRYPEMAALWRSLLHHVADRRVLTEGQLVAAVRRPYR